jgi:arginine utilization regulatory protein
VEDTVNRLKIYEEILSRLEEGVHVVDSEGKTLIYNEAMASIEGMTAEDVLEENLLKILPALGYESTHMEVLRSGEAIESKYQEYISKKGKKIAAVNSTYPIKENGKIVGSVEISKDITFMRNMSNRMIDLYSEVADKKIGTFSFEDIIGKSKAMQNIIKECKQIAKSSSNVLIIGESGTGKEMFAQSIHNSSLRRDKPFIAENCAAIPENLLESILFGTTKGSFTGAENKDGLFKQADGGTLMLDEINSMPLSLQAKILRVLETGSFRPIGSNKEHHVDVRIIAVTNKDPLELVGEGKFREDLFYRLSVINIRVPNLQERKIDIPVIADYYVEYYENALHKKISGISEEVLKFFNKYDWPGNVRELKHIIEGAASMINSGDEIKLIHLPYYIKNKLNIEMGEMEENYIKSSIRALNEGKKSLEEVLGEVEKDIITSLLDENSGNITKTSEILGIKRQGLQYKLKKYKV